MNSTGPSNTMTTSGGRSFCTKQRPRIYHTEALFKAFELLLSIRSKSTRRSHAKTSTDSHPKHASDLYSIPPLLVRRNHVELIYQVKGNVAQCRKSTRSRHRLRRYESQSKLTIEVLRQGEQSLYYLRNLHSRSSRSSCRFH